ncbi:MAG: hypothetical protein KOO63_08330 [Bacteroidales bacterium]|nr:hypothetical protein [Candidatus Latescibacterota bacterium]
MKLGTQVKLPDGRVGTCVYNSLIGEGIKWGHHDPDPKEFEDTDGNTVLGGSPDEWEWEPDALLREPWPESERFGFTAGQCVGDEFEIIRNGL